MNPALREALNAGAAIATITAGVILFWHWPVVWYWLFGKKSKRSEPDRKPYGHWQDYDPTLDSWDEDERPGNWK